ncbi:MAG: hypothetical protein ACOX52_06560 [Verrucomicrobiota bacterium]
MVSIDSDTDPDPDYTALIQQTETAGLPTVRLGERPHGWRLEAVLRTFDIH